MRVWANMSMTHAENKILEKDDAPLLAGYQKVAVYNQDGTYTEQLKKMYYM